MFTAKASAGLNFAVRMKKTGAGRPHHTRCHIDGRTFLGNLTFGIVK
jgi:hypothetical protein